MVKRREIIRRYIHRIVFSFYLLLISSQAIALGGESSGEDVSREDSLEIIGSVERALELKQRPDETRTVDQYTVPLFGLPLIIGGEVEVEIEQRRDYTLKSEPDDLNRISTKVDLEIFYQLSHHYAMFLEAVALARHDEWRETHNSDSRYSWRRGEMWVFSGGWFQERVSYQIGRQNFNDDREWWWDANLDAARIHYDSENLHVEAALATELARQSTDKRRIDTDQDGVIRFLISATIQSKNKSERSLFMLFQHDYSHREAEGDVLRRDLRDESDLNALWLGWRARGRWNHGSSRSYYWLDSGLVWGNERVIDYERRDSIHVAVDNISRRRVRGAAIDIGINWQTSWPGKITFTAGYAMGSGDDNKEDNVDGNYRQTGLQDNNDKFRGVTSFRYYGDLFRPELSNLEITTLGVGFRFLEKSSLDFVWHTYRQVEPTNVVRNTRLDINPDGTHETLGNEMNIVIGVEEFKHWEYELVMSRFHAGKAFGDRRAETADKLILSASYRF